MYASVRQRSIACFINDVKSPVCPQIPTIIAGLIIGYSSFAFIWKSISVCLSEVCTINSNFKYAIEVLGAAVNLGWAHLSSVVCHTLHHVINYYAWKKMVPSAVLEKCARSSELLFENAQNCTSPKDEQFNEKSYDRKSRINVMKLMLSAFNVIQLI